MIAPVVVPFGRGVAETARAEMLRLEGLMRVVDGELARARGAGSRRVRVRDAERLAALDAERDRLQKAYDELHAFLEWYAVNRCRVTRKMKYPTSERALECAPAGDRHRELLTAYRCRHCAQWHLGHVFPPVAAVGAGDHDVDEKPASSDGRMSYKRR